MISCVTFRNAFAPGTESAEVLQHVRVCDACLDHAAGIDPDIMFRALGGENLVPPGGVDAFVDDVMREVRLRSTEQTLAGRRGMLLSWPRRIAVAATLAAGLSGALMVWQHDKNGVAVPSAMTARSAAIPTRLTTKPVIESYDSANATIVEVPSEANDTKIVMIFDESLPADL
ncbi:MAG: hypothetical protein JOZ54_02885 [Acidobacteria bacterium]|nr:hypothetical protein [Acidobacteriota bacterium]